MTAPSSSKCLHFCLPELNFLSNFIKIISYKENFYYVQTTT